MGVQYSNVASWQCFGDIVYVVNEETNEIFILDGIGAEIWSLIEKERDIERILNKLSRQYDVPYEQLVIDVNEFIEGLNNAGLILK